MVESFPVEGETDDWERRTGGGIQILLQIKDPKRTLLNYIHKRPSAMP